MCIHRNLTPSFTNILLNISPLCLSLKLSLLLLTLLLLLLLLLQNKDHPNFEACGPMSKDWRLDLDGRPTTDDQFVIRHYAGPIVYTVDDFLRKNKDTLYSHLVSLGSASENPLLQHLFQIVAPAASGDGAGTPRGGGRRGTSMQATVGDRFHKRLGELMKMIRETRPSFVRCIKSNTTFAPGVFDDINILRQLHYAGVIAALEMRAHGYDFLSLCWYQLVLAYV
jgi:hypothetical protein